MHVSQERLARSLGKSQAAVAQMEQRSDMKVSTLRETIEAMGGKLELVAHFPAGDVTITHLGEIADEPTVTDGNSQRDIAARAPSRRRGRAGGRAPCACPARARTRRR